MKLIMIMMTAAILFSCATDSSNKGTSTDTNTSNPSESLAPQVITEPGTLPTIQPTTPPKQDFKQNPNQTNVTADETGKVWHFVCADGCKGGVGDAKSACPVCGKELAHNQAYHNADAAQPAANTATGTGPQIVQPGAGPQIVTPPSPEPAQNANGVWHYTCAKGCAGGAGSAGPCAGCGGTLAHNSAYHQ